MGKPWTEQRSRSHLVAVVEAVREDIRMGWFDLRTWDHNSPQYRGGVRSNKTLTIAATAALGRPPVDYEEATEVITWLAAGGPL